MAQEATPASTEILSRIKVNNRGWNITLFCDKNTISNELCGNCNSVCCDAVELGCDHIDQDIYLYCNNCLIKLIGDNNNKCPIDLHLNPIITPVRSVRRSILQSIVICPYSSKYKYKHNIHLQIIDTSQYNAIEGIGNNNDNDDNNNGCKWKGTLDNLITEHLPKCMLHYDPSFTLNIKIKKLQQENKILNEITENQKKQIMKQSNKLNENTLTISTLKQQNKKLKKTLVEKLLIIHEINAKSNNVKNNVNEQDTIYNAEEFQEENDKKFNDKNDKKLIFHVNNENKHLFKISNNGKTVCWKGKVFSDPTWILCGDFCEKNEEITVYFEMPTIGDNVCYGFGFISKDFSKWINGYNELKNGLIINGYGVIYSSHEFYTINNNAYKIPKQLKKFKYLFDTSLTSNIIAISINMKEKIGMIWNENTKETVLKLMLPQTVGIVLSFAGNQSKKATIIKHT